MTIIDIILQSVPYQAWCEDYNWEAPQLTPLKFTIAINAEFVNLQFCVNIVQGSWDIWIRKSLRKSENKSPLSRLLDTKPKLWGWRSARHLHQRCLRSITERLRVSWLETPEMSPKVYFRVPLDFHSSMHDHKSINCVTKRLFLVDPLNILGLYTG